MKKLLYTVFAILLAITSLSCVQEASSNATHQSGAEPPTLKDSVYLKDLKERVRSSMAYKNFQKGSLDLALGSVNGTISVRGTVKDSVLAAGRNVKSVEEFEKKLEAAGVKGAKQYAEAMFLQTRSMREIFTEFPELRKIKREDMAEIIKLETPLGYAIELPIKRD